jgi:hypothetical protein
MGILTSLTKNLAFYVILFMEPRTPPTKAEIEFIGDCFSRLYDADAAECEACLVNMECFNKMKKRGISLPEGVEETTRETDREQVTPSTPATSVRNPFREGTAAWVIGESILSLTGDFGFDEVYTKTEIMLKETAIPCRNPSVSVRQAIFQMQSRGIIEKVTRGRFRQKQSS